MLHHLHHALACADGIEPAFKIVDVELSVTDFLHYQTARVIINADHFIVNTIDVQHVFCGIWIHQKQVHIVLIQSNIPAKDKFDVATVVAHLFGSHK